MKINLKKNEHFFATKVLIPNKLKSSILLCFTFSIASACRTVDDNPETHLASDVKSTSSVKNSDASVDKTEIYSGTENNGKCELQIVKDPVGNTIAMNYESKECNAKEKLKLSSCRLSIFWTPELPFVKMPSLQFPGYTRIGFFHGAFGSAKPKLAGAYLWDQFILAKDNLTTLKVVSREAMAAPDIPSNIASEAWTSDCLNMKKVQ